MPAEGVWTDCHLTLGGTDLSAYVRSVALVHDVASVEQTAMADTYRTNLSALEAWSVELDLVQATDVVDYLIFPLTTTTSSVAIVILEDDSATSGLTNPAHYGNVIVTNYVPFQGGVGDFNTCRVSLVGASSYGRDTSTV